MLEILSSKSEPKRNRDTSARRFAYLVACVHSSCRFILLGTEKSDGGIQAEGLPASDRGRGYLAGHQHPGAVFGTRGPASQHNHARVAKRVAARPRPAVVQSVFRWDLIFLNPDPVRFDRVYALVFKMYLRFSYAFLCNMSVISGKSLDIMKFVYVYMFFPPSRICNKPDYC